MRIIHAKSPNHALWEGLHHLRFHGIVEESRNGNVIVSSMPVTTLYKKPNYRVLLGATRDANPFFHLFEALWMLAGQNDVHTPRLFVGNFGQYSDDGTTLHGAYGHRWRSHFGYDQLEVIVEELKTNPKSRRCVLQMWDARELSDNNGGDLMFAVGGGKDVPCNTAAYFDTIGGKLNMTVTNRSNDVIWGAYGANLVHMSMLLEYMAARIGIQMGEYRQFSNNFHVYENLLPREKFGEYADTVAHECYYGGMSGALRSYEYVKGLEPPMPLCVPAEDWDAWHYDLYSFMREVAVYPDNARADYQTPFFRGVAQPMWQAWQAFKQKDFVLARTLAQSILSEDWSQAAVAWIARRNGK